MMIGYKGYLVMGTRQSPIRPRPSDQSVMGLNLFNPSNVYCYFIDLNLFDEGKNPKIQRSRNNHTPNTSKLYKVKKASFYLILPQIGFFPFWKFFKNKFIKIFLYIYAFW